MWSALVLWMACVLLLSSIPGNELKGPDLFPGFDKVAHFLLFSIGGLTTGLSLQSSFRLLPRNVFIPLGWLFLAAFAALDEYYQLSVPYRSGADLGDWIADVIGAFAGLLFSLSAYEYLGRKFRPPQSAGTPQAD